MAFKISAYMQVSEEQNELYTYSNCSEFSFIKDNVYYTDGTNNTFPIINFDVQDGSVKKEHVINTLNVGGGKMYCLTHIQLLNTSKKSVCIFSASRISEENEDEFLFTTEKLISKGFNESDLTSTSTVYVYFIYSYCKEIVYPKSAQKYFGYPKIIYGDSNNNTIISNYIAVTDDINRFWICENTAGEYATSFDNWKIYLYRLTKENNVYKSDFVCSEQYSGTTHFMSSVQFAQIGIDDTSLVQVRNENLIKSDDFRKTPIYNTYTGELLSGNICYFIVEASYIAKKPRVVFWKRNGDGMFTKSYTYGENLELKPLSGDEIYMTKYGYTFDGYYIKSSGDNNDTPPHDDTNLGDKSAEYRKIVNSDGKFISGVKNFTGDNHEYINIIPEKYAFGNWNPKTTTIKLNWNIERVESRSTITINGTVANDTQIINLNSLNTSAYNTFGLSYKTTEKFGTICENLINDKNIKIPVIKEKVGNQTITWEFCGFYKEVNLSNQIIESDGVFKRNTSYTNSKKWDTDKSEITLYAKWAKGGYYEVHKEGKEGVWGSCPDGYKPYYGTGSHAKNKGEKQEDMNMPYLCYWEKNKNGENDYKRDANGNPEIDHDMNFDGYYLYKADGTRGEYIVRPDGVFKLYTSCTDGIRRNKKEGKVELYAYWYGDKLRIKTESNGTSLGTTSGDGKYKKTKNCTITAKVKDAAKYCFVGWQKDGVSLDNGFISKSTSYTFKVEKSEKYIGYFGVKSYTINYKDVGNTKCTAENYIDPTSTIVAKQDEYLPLCTSWWGTGIPKAYKKGYVFIGWYKDSAGTIELDKDKNGDYIIGEGVTNDITLYAKWEKTTLKGIFILKPGKGAWKSGVNPPISGTTVVYGNKMPSIDNSLIPELDGYTFIGFYDKDWHQVIDKECTDWRKNTRYVDENGNSIMTDTYEFTAKFSKDINFVDVTSTFTKSLNCNITSHSNIDFKKSIEDKIATTNWINTTIGIPEINYYDDLIKNFYNSSMEETYNSNKGMADKYFFNDFDFDDNKLLKQSDIIDFFDNSATKLENLFYLKDIIYDTVNNKTIISANFIEKNAPLFPSEYNGSKDTIIYFTINDDKSVVYKMCIDEIKKDNSIFEITLQYFDIEFPHLTDNINKITIEHISCFAIDNLNNTRTYYKPYLVFNKFTDLDLTIEKNTILNNVEIKEYSSDELVKEPIIDGPSNPIVDKVNKDSPYIAFAAEEDNSSIGLESLSNNQTLEYSTDTTNWEPFDANTNISLNTGDGVYVRGILSADNTFNNYTQFKMSGKIAAYGNCNAIWNYQDLNASLKKYCGGFMFKNCTSLTTAPALPATTLANSCYYMMFYGCTSLTTAPALPATTLADGCYNEMFNGCSSLTQAPALPATTLTHGCYQNMFNSCTLLSTAPALAATTLMNNCYAGMFQGCTSLSTAPTLPATTLVDYCYKNMFYGCTNLSHIECLATNISASECTTKWVYEVASTGTFVKHSDMSGWTTGINGIPVDWEVA